jgi:chaperonin cofactor prefoldin
MIPYTEYENMMEAKDEKITELEEKIEELKEEIETIREQEGRLAE